LENRRDVLREGHVAGGLRTADAGERQSEGREDRAGAHYY
jgi:hypothetical protein